MREYLEIASNLYYGGWRANDRAELKETYDLEPLDVSEICSWLAYFENSE